MPFTKCPNCRKIHRVAPALVEKEVGCMNERCAIRFKAFEYRLHSGTMSLTVFLLVIGFALFMLIRWIWLNSTWIVSQLG